MDTRSTSLALLLQRITKGTNPAIMGNPIKM